MRALVVTPKNKDSAALVEVDEPRAERGALSIEMVAVGICGTDKEILAGAYGEAPPGEETLILGHESLGRVLAAPDGSGLAAGDLVVPMVRRPDPVPCEACAAGEWDMCRNGRYTEHGIKGVHGFCRERYAIEPERVIKVDRALGLAGVLVEPTSVVAKAWEHALAIGGRARFTPRRALVTGGGPIGLLAALLGVQRGIEVHILDHNEDGPKPRLARELGATYHSDEASIAALADTFDVILECTGVAGLVLSAMRWVGPGGVVCLTGVSSGGRKLKVDMAALGTELVLENAAIFGTVNANRHHYKAAAAALAKADRAWLGRIMTKRVPLERWSEALERGPDDVKAVILGPGAEV